MIKTVALSLRAREREKSVKMLVKRVQEILWHITFFVKVENRITQFLWFNPSGLNRALSGPSRLSANFD